VATWVGLYQMSTPGTAGYDNTSNLMGPEAEPQPDICLLISPPAGGQTSDKDDWIVGAPELIVEVASSTESIDLHGKKADYEKCSVREYVVVVLRQKRVFWFCTRDDSFVELSPGADGIFRSQVFPGLWLDPIALLAGKMVRVRQVLDTGLATPEHAAFVARLGASS
jgi:Uma2 family endonuclease